MGSRIAMRPRRPSRRRLLLLVALLALTSFLALAIVAARQHFFELDRTAYTYAYVERNAALQAFMEKVSLLGTGGALIPLILAGSVILWSRRRRGWALYLPALMAGAGALQFLAKWAVDRPRPNLNPHGFPSGHVLVLVVLFGAVLYLIVTTTSRRRWRFLASALFVLPVLIVAYSRLYLRAHWLTDVIGGFAAGLAYVIVGIVTAELIAARRERRATTAPPAPVSPNAAG
jgi:membrane-associated phospholipid phosphatase